MSEPLVWITGFGAFEDVDDNPSGRLAERLSGAPPAGIRVRAEVLPASFRRAPEAWDRVLGGAEAERPRLVLALGVHKEPGFRLERRARGRLPEAERTDVDGVTAAAATARAEGVRVTPLDLDALVRDWEGRLEEGIFVSEDAGGYVCERLYHHVLARAEGLGVAGLFLHVPPLRFTALERQAEVVAGLLGDLVGR